MKAMHSFVPNAVKKLLMNNSGWKDIKK